jgi:hypothetical protein
LLANHGKRRLMNEPHVIAEVRGYDEFTAALRSWIRELGTNYECIGALAGLQDGYLNTLLASTPVKSFSRISLGATLGALCLKLLVAVDTERLDAMRPRYTARKRQAHADDVMPRKKSHHLRGNSQYMRILRQKGVLILSSQRRRQIARHAAAVRWRSDVSALNQIAVQRSNCPNMGERMRNLKLTLTVDAELRGILEEGAEREGRSISNVTRRLLDRAAREVVRAQRLEPQQEVAA